MAATNNFIPPSLVIQQIRSAVPAFGDRVAGASQFEAIEDIQDCPVPACFVLLSDTTAETTSMQTTLQQKILHGFDILLVLDAVDRRKQEAEEISVGFKDILLYALNGWKPYTPRPAIEGEPNYLANSPLQYLGDSYVSADRGRYVRMYRFGQDNEWKTSTDGIGEGQTTDIFDTFIAELLVDNTDKILPIQITDLYDS